jgi:tRNA threonylcarbamoyl adenosine modification protein YeaZ
MSDNQTVLVIDTAMAGCGVCVYDVARDVVFDAYSDDPRGQAQVLVPMVQGVLNDADLGFEDLTDIVVCNGPGTFTGIRIGLSAAKTFGMVVDVPVYGVGSMQALAMSAVDKGLSQEMLAIVETRRQDFYVLRFDEAGLALDEPRSLMAEDVDVGGAVLIGDAAQRFDPDGRYEHFDMQRIDVGVVAKYFSKSAELFSSDVEPIYLRAPDVSQPKKAPRKIEV